MSKELLSETKFYNSKDNCLLYIKSKANNVYWDDHWNSDNLKRDIQESQSPLVVKHTKKYLTRASKLLEGGCGKGQNVYLLKKQGFRVVGIDYAEDTVRSINSCMPELDIRLGDVRGLPFEDDSFDGYWSLGVIEHFYEGYQPIMSEMYRVLKPGGILFMTVPTMSFMRKFKSKLGLYPKWNNNPVEIDNFYQFALDPNLIITNFENNGFKLIEKKPYDGFKGFKDEVGFLRGVLQPIYDSSFILNKIFRKIIDLLTVKFSSHMTLFIFKK